MATGLFVDGENRVGDQSIYFLVEIGNEPGKIDKLPDGLTPILHGTKLRLSYDPACEKQIVGTVESYLSPFQGGKFEYADLERNVISVDNLEVKRIFGWVYLVGAKWLSETD